MERDESSSKQTPTQTEQPKPKHKKWPWIIGVIAIVIFVPLLVAGYFGIVPGVSTVMGAKSAKDLGVRYTAADFTSYQAKTGAQFLDFANAPANPAKPGKKIVFANPQPLSTSVSQAEITAAINKSGWLWMPLSNTQVRFGDGTVEVSGNLQLTHLKEFIGFIGGVGYSNADVDKGIAWASKLLNGAPVYIKANASITNNVLSLQVTDAQVGRISIPIDQAQKALQAGTNSAISRTAGLQVDTATLSAGAINFKGTIPTVVYVKKN